MPRYVGLLRGVNVGGNNLVPMPELRTLLTSLGLCDVSTYIQSGNVIFTSDSKVTPERLETAIATSFGFHVDVVLCTSSELQKVTQANPFAGADLATVHVGFMKDEPPRAAVAKLDPGPFAPEKFAIRGTELYLHLPQGVGRSKLLTYLGRQLKTPTTLRSWKTVMKLVELAG